METFGKTPRIAVASDSAGMVPICADEPSFDDVDPLAVVGLAAMTCRCIPTW